MPHDFLMCSISFLLRQPMLFYTHLRYLLKGVVQIQLSRILQMNRLAGNIVLLILGCDNGKKKQFNIKQQNGFLTSKMEYIHTVIFK